MANRETTTCQYSRCGKPIAVVRGHRPRAYCDDSCKQAAFRARKGQSSGSVTIVDDSLPKARITKLERERDRLQAHITHLEQERGSRSLIEEQNTRRREQYAIDCALSATQAKEWIATLEQELAREKQGSEQLQERFRQYVAMTNEKLSGLTSELTTFRQEREHSTKRVTKADMRELEQARTDLLRLYQERAHQGEEVHRLYELAQDYQRNLGAARNRIAELEQQPATHICKGTDEQFMAEGERLGFPELHFSTGHREIYSIIRRGEEFWRRFSQGGELRLVKIALEVARSL